MEVSYKKLKIELPYDPAVLLLGIYLACSVTSVVSDSVTLWAVAR